MRTVMALSGGMDSTSLLLHLLTQNCKITCISFNYGQKHVIEIEKAKANIRYLNDLNLQIEHIIIDITDCMNSLYSALTDSEVDVPEGHYEEEQMKKTVVPNRNAIFSSILYAHALSIATKDAIDVQIALGVHSGDHAIYPDCRPDFYEAIHHAFSIGNWESEKVSLFLPYLEENKTTILQDALHSCQILNLDFDHIMRHTHTSYNPDASGRSSGRSGADVERILAFHEINRQDPIDYISSWEDVLGYALQKQKEQEM